MQTYRLQSVTSSAWVEWCPICNSGRLHSSGEIDIVRSLRSIIGRDDTPPVGWIDDFRERLQ
jgi:hypothetical protein